MRRTSMIHKHFKFDPVLQEEGAARRHQRAPRQAEQPRQVDRDKDARSGVIQVRAEQVECGE